MRNRIVAETILEKRAFLKPSFLKGFKKPQIPSTAIPKIQTKQDSLSKPLKAGIKL